MSEKTTPISVRVRRNGSAISEVVELHIPINKLGKMSLGNRLSLANQLKPFLEEELEADVVLESITDVRIKDGLALLPSAEAGSRDKKIEETDSTEPTDEEVVYLGSDSMLRRPFSLIPEPGGFITLG